eukprot:SAG22_NODE_5984_length_921_cov_1.190998_1_plen_306_part_11
MLEVIGEATGQLIDTPSELFGGSNSMHLLARRVDVTVQGLQTLSSFCPAAAASLDGLGMTPLHRICENGANRLDVLSRLAELQPASVRVSDHHGQTPLHVLLLGPETFDTGSLISMAEELIRLNPIGLFVANPPRFCSPLHQLTEGARLTEHGVGSMAVAGGPDAQVLQDVDGRTPLHNCAANRLCTLQMLQAMVHYNPEALAVQDKQGSTVFHRLIENKALLKRPEAEFTLMLDFMARSCPHGVALKNTTLHHGKKCPHQTALSALCERAVVSPQMLKAVLRADPSSVYVADAHKCRPKVAIGRR